MPGAHSLSSRRLALILTATALVLAVVATARAASAAPQRGISGAASQRQPSAGVPERAAATVEGTVYDSIAGARMPGVTVHFARADDPARSLSAVTDGEGRYELRDVPPGRYYAAFFPTPLDSLGFESPVREVEVRDGRQRIDLGTPSPMTLARTVCGEHVSDSTGVLLGHVRDTRTLEAIVDAAVVVEWSEYVLEDGVLRHRDRRVETRAAGPGWFAFCNLPGETILTARASHVADSSGYVEVQLAAGELRHVSFHIGGASLVAAASVAEDSAAAPSTTPVWRGGAALSGMVRDGEGQAISGATVAVWGSGLEVRTNDRGAFAIDGLPGGTQTVEARVIGFEPVRRAVQLSAHTPATIDIVLAKRAVVLEEVRVRGELVYSRNLLDFERRRRMGSSMHFLSPSEIEKWPTVTFPRLLQGMPGVEVQCRRSNECLVRMRAGTGMYGARYCEPTLWIDGNRDFTGMWNILYSDELAAVEVYPHRTSVPSEFFTDVTCGAVVVWTRPPAAKVRAPRRRD